MLLKSSIKQELDYEKKLLKKDLDRIASYPDCTLTCSKTQGGILQFFYRKKGKSKKHFLSHLEVEKIRAIAYRKFLQTRISYLTRNIALLSPVADGIMDYDDESVISRLPKSYQDAIRYLKSQSDSGPATRNGPQPSTPASPVIQSENPKDRQNLIITCSNGLMVRTKGEMTIAEELIRFGIEFRYEMRLELTKITVSPSGTAVMETVTKYPDFTIFLADGTVLYWEHAGMFKEAGYRRDHFAKLELYFENDILPGKNLIVTMDAKDGSFDNMQIRKIVQTQISPFC